MKHVKTLNKANLKETAAKGGCGCGCHDCDGGCDGEHECNGEHECHGEHDCDCGCGK